MWDLGAFDGIGEDFWHTGYVVFDDIQWDSLKSSAKSWFGAQQDFSVSDKYKHKRRMRGGVPAIFLCNPDSFTGDCMDFFRNSWGRANVDEVYLHEPLF